MRYVRVKARTQNIILIPLWGSFKNLLQAPLSIIVIVIVIMNITTTIRWGKYAADRNLQPRTKRKII